MDESRIRRLRWRARRGLLENDLLLTRFLERHQGSLSEADVAGLDALLELADNELLDLILGRIEPRDQIGHNADARRVLAMLRSIRYQRPAGT